MKKKLFLAVLLLVFFSVASFFGLQFYFKTGVFKVPGKLLFSDSFPEEEKAVYSELFAETELEKDLTLSLETSPSKKSSSETSPAFLLDVFVPTADFYEPASSLSLSEFASLYESSDPSVISVSDLKNNIKLLAVEDEGKENYFLDTFDSGAMFKYLVLSSESEEDLSLAKSLISPTLKSFPESSTTLTFLQTGVTALSRGMTAKLSAAPDATYFTKNIADFLSSFDLTHTSNEASFTNLATSSNICSKPEMIDVLTSAGVDIVELTGNHNLDCGAEAALETLDLYESLDIRTVGGGKNAEAAKVPLEISEKGTNLTILGFNESTGGATTGDYPGANQYYEAVAREQISEAKARGDVVIVDVQYYECNNYDNTYENPACDAANSSAGDQIGLFRSLIDMGADVVVGTSAHQTQTYELYGDGVIYYGLGNLFFDQYWWPGTTRSLALGHYFYNGKLLQTRLFGTVYDSSMQTELMDKETLEWFIDRLNQAR
ncbi:CapA family protein [Candidatus Saccharibacteria bacterium]|nr:CapA family protein [Candidatus Saccharibacteria bacterium]